MHARIALLAVLLGTGTCAHAQKHCETLIALSKTVSSVVSGRSSVEQNAQNFCSEYARTTSSSRSTSFGASYKFLSLSLGNSGASADEVASAQLAARKVATNYVESFSTMVRYHDQCNSAAAAYNDQLPGAAAAQNLCRARGFTGGIPQQALGDNFGFVCVM